MAAVSPTYWDTPTGLPGLGCLQREFFTWSTWTTTSASFFWPVPFLYHPSSNACFLKELSTKGITFSPERHLLTAQIPCSLSLFRLFWGMFLIHDAGRREKYAVKTQFSGMRDKSPLLQSRATLGSCSELPFLSWWMMWALNYIFVYLSQSFPLPYLFLD